MTIDTMQPFEQAFTVQQQQDQDSSDSLYNSPNDNYLMETFHQYPHGDFHPTFYNPFEIKHRRRTSRDQLKILEKSFSENAKPSAAIRRILAQKLEMTPRGVQIWFQNRRAKAKLLRRKSNGSSPASEQQQDFCQDLKKSNIKRVKKSSPTDVNQSSVLFSQFFASVDNNTQNANDFNDYITSVEDSQKKTWQSSNSISESVRTVATAAAATAVATSSNSYETSMLALGGNSQWLGQDTTEEIFHHSGSRRGSCNAPKNTMLMSDLNYSQQSAYVSPSWSHTMMPQGKDVGNSSPIPLLNSFKRNFSYDAYSPPSIGYYPMQDINISSYHQQLTPPLTASCSASTVAGSPIQLDNLYNDPVVVPSGYYSHVSSPLSATTMVNEMMPNFV